MTDSQALSPDRVAEYQRRSSQPHLRIGPSPSIAASCELDACKVCTGCAHQGSRECAGTVRCPTTGEVNACRYARKDGTA